MKLTMALLMKAVYGDEGEYKKQFRTYSVF